MPQQVTNTFVVCMGIGTVFAGLILIIVMCKIVGFLCKAFVKPETQEKTVTPIPSDIPPEADRSEIIAAVTAACAEDMGTDVSALRVVSFRKL